MTADLQNERRYFDVTLQTQTSAASRRELRHVSGPKIDCSAHLWSSPDCRSTNRESRKYRSALGAESTRSSVRVSIHRSSLCVVSDSANGTVPTPSTTMNCASFERQLRSTTLVSATASAQDLTSLDARSKPNRRLPRRREIPPTTTAELQLHFKYQFTDVRIYKRTKKITHTTKYVIR